MIKTVQLSNTVNATTASVEYRLPYRRGRIVGASIAAHYQINAASTGFFGWYAVCLLGTYDGTNVLIGGSPSTGRESQVVAFARRYTAQGTANANGLYDLNEYYPVPGIPIGQFQIVTWHLNGSAVVVLTAECFLHIDVLQ